MEFARQVNRRLHEEHAATQRLCAQLGQTLAARPWPPEGSSRDEVARVLRSSAAALAGEVARHFEFEESELFPRLGEAGDADLAAMLAEEHATIRDAVQRFAALEAAVRAQSIDAQGWQQLRVAGHELTERLAAHAEKEEASLLPAIEDLLDEETDQSLFALYAMV